MMAHRSKKKHVKHLHEQEPATPPAKSPVVKAETARARIAKPTPRKRGAATSKKRATGRAAEVKRGTERVRTREAATKKRAAASVRMQEPELRQAALKRRAAERVRMQESELRQAALKRRAAETVRMQAHAVREAAKPGFVRRLANKATKTLSDRLPLTPRKVLSRAKARMKARVSRVRSLLGTEA